MKKLVVIGLLSVLGAMLVAETQAGIFRKGPRYIFSWRRPSNNVEPAPVPVAPPIDDSIAPPTQKEIQLSQLIATAKKTIEQGGEAEVEEPLEETTYTKGIIALLSALGIGGAVLGAKSAFNDK